MPPLSALLDEATAHLAGVSDSPRLDAELLLAHALARPRSHLRAHPEAQAGAAQEEFFRELLAARLRGEPIAYLTGEREFWSLPLKVTPAVLVPRPETELLVEQLLQHVAADAGAEILDLGTGSGAIAIALAHERRRWRITAVDRSAAALQVAESNAAALGLSNVEFRQGDWFEAVSGRRFHAVVSNPPYVAEGDPHLEDLRFEPRAALTSGPDGLRDIRTIIAGTPQHLHAGGILLLEHGVAQGEAVRALLARHGFVQVETLRDLAGHERVSGGRRAGDAAPG